MFRGAFSVFPFLPCRIAHCSHLPLNFAVVVFPTDVCQSFGEVNLHSFHTGYSGYCLLDVFLAVVARHLAYGIYRHVTVLRIALRRIITVMVCQRV